MAVAIFDKTPVRKFFILGLASTSVVMISCIVVKVKQNGS